MANTYKNSIHKSTKIYMHSAKVSLFCYGG